MKKTQMALAAVALVASTAVMADGIKVSGYVDAGFASQSPGAKFVSGLNNINQLNFSGSEDLGNGLKADFFLQHRFELSNGNNTTGSVVDDGAGTATNPKRTSVFNQSTVGLSGDFGSISMGRGVDALWGNAAAAFDVTGGHNMGSFVASVINKSASPIFGDSMIKYASPNLNGLNLAVSYYANTSAASAVGTTTKNDYSLGATYALGSINLGAGYANRSDASGAGTVTFLGAGSDLGFAKVNVVYLDTANKGSTYGFNTAIPVPGVEALSLNAGYYSDTGATTADDGTLTSIGGQYALSKRTNVFANYQTTSGAFKTYTGLSDSYTPSAAAKSAFTVGLGHSF